ncbi:MAG: hypothetical protein IJT08_02585 [Alphaproteobacteria bacterium]|nr:hypothetical protein [Alphaproteobacteria bacterium]
MLKKVVCLLVAIGVGFECNAGLFDGISGALNKVKSQASATLNSTVSKVKTKASNFASTAKSKASQTIASAKNAASSKASQALGGAKEKFGALKNKASETIASSKAAALGKVNSTLETVKGKVDLAKNKAASAVNSARGAALDVWNKVANEEKNTPEMAPEKTEEYPATPEKTEEYPATSVKKIDNCLPSEDAVRESKLIDLSEAELTDEDIPYLAHKLKSLANAGIEKVTLNLSNKAKGTNGLGIDELAQLFEELKAYPKFLSILDLSGNKIGDDGAVILLEYVKNFPMLEFLVMSDTAIGDYGASVMVSEIVKGELNLQMLDLSNNTIQNPAGLTEQLQEKGNILPDGLILSGNTP